MYGAGASKISQQVTADSGKYFSKQNAQEVIDDYFRQFSSLKRWIDHSSKYIMDNGFIYSYFGRKRRLPNVYSDNQGIQSHEVRSGLNFLQISATSFTVMLSLERWKISRLISVFSAMNFMHRTTSKSGTRLLS